MRPAGNFVIMTMMELNRDVKLCIASWHEMLFD